MKTIILVLSALLALSACATAGHGTRAAARADGQLALYRDHAGAPVAQIPFSASVDNWTYLGPTALAVWTSPSRAWLLELDAPCRDLEFAQAIGFDSRGMQISAGFDSVVVLSRAAGPYIPCRIRIIQPLDVAAIRQAERGGD
jgi:uncharacterized protein YceK